MRRYPGVQHSLRLRVSQHRSPMPRAREDLEPPVDRRTRVEEGARIVVEGIVVHRGREQRGHLEAPGGGERVDTAEPLWRAKREDALDGRADTRRGTHYRRPAEGRAADDDPVRAASTQ